MPEAQDNSPEIKLTPIVGTGYGSKVSAMDSLAEATGLDVSDLERSSLPARSLNAGDGHASVATKEDVVVIAYETSAIDHDGSLAEGLAQGLKAFAKSQGGRYEPSLELPGPVGHYEPIYYSPDMLATYFDAGSHTMEEFREANPNALIVTVGEYEHSNYALRLGYLVEPHEELSSRQAYYVPEAHYQGLFSEALAAGQSPAEAFTALRQDLSRDIDVLGDAMNGWATNIGAVAIDRKSGEVLFEESTSGYLSSDAKKTELQQMAKQAMSVGLERAAELRQKEAAEAERESARVSQAATLGFAMTAAKETKHDGETVFERKVVRTDENGKPVERADIGASSHKALDELTLKVAQQATARPDMTLASIVNEAVKGLSKGDMER